MLCADVLEVCWTDSLGRKQQAVGLLEDISESGACLQLERSVPIDADVVWAAQNLQFSGQVRYCIYREIGYFVGVEFTPGQKWSADAFEPQHLLDVRTVKVNRPAAKGSDHSTDTGLTIQ